MSDPVLSVVAIAKNEERDLARFLESFAELADEIVIVDDGSTDRTVEIAEAAGPNVRVVRAPRGPDDGFCDLRNRGVEEARGEWLLQVDVDMRPGPGLAAELAAAVRNSGLDAYRFRLKNFLLHRPMRYGGWGKWNQPWFARRDKVRWEQKVHERIRIDAPAARIGQLSHPMWHLNDATWEGRMRKSLEYSIAEAQRIVDTNERVRVHHLVLKPLWYSVKYYVLRGGFRDGMMGLVFALHTFSATFHWHALAWDRQNPLSRDELERRVRATEE